MAITEFPIPTKAFALDDFPGITGPEILVAADDAPAAVKARADYVCSGTNDHIEIQAALDASDFVALAGSFSVAATIRLQSGHRLVGIYDATLTLANGANLSGHDHSEGDQRIVHALLTTGDWDATEVEDVLIENVKIVGNETRSNEETIAGVYIYNAKNVILQNVHAENWGWGVDHASGWRAFCLLVVDSINVDVNGGVYSRAGYECVGFRRGTENCTVRNAVLKEGFIHAAQTTQMWPGSVQSGGFTAYDNCWIENDDPTDGGSGITLHTAMGGRVTGNMIRARTIGVNLFAGSSNWIVANNRIQQNEAGGACVRIGRRLAADAAVENIAVTGNLLSSLNTAAPSSGGVNIGPARRVTVAGNTIRCGGGASGVYISGLGTNATPPSDIAITGNQIHALEQGSKGIEILADGAAAPQNVTISANTVESHNDSIECSGLINSTISGNIVKPASGGNGRGIRLSSGSKMLMIAGNQVVAQKEAMQLVSCQNVSISGNAFHSITEDASQLTGSTEVVLANCFLDSDAKRGITQSGAGGNTSTNVRIADCVIKAGTNAIRLFDGVNIAITGVRVAAAGSVAAISVPAGLTNVLVEGCDTTGAANVGSFSSGKVVRNLGYVTESSGTATIADGNTSVTVAHGLSATPEAKDITVTPTNNMGDAAKFWVSGIGASNFTINVDANPGASTATFAWQVGGP